MSRGTAGNEGNGAAMRFDELTRQNSSKRSQDAFVRHQEVTQEPCDVQMECAL